MEELRFHAFDSKKDVEMYAKDFANWLQKLTGEKNAKSLASVEWVERNCHSTHPTFLKK